MKITYRTATLLDIDELCELRKIQLQDEGITPSINIDKELRTFFKNALKDQTLYQIVGCIDNKIIVTGAVCFYDYPPTYTNKTGKIAYITNMYTIDEYRKKGLASEVLHMLEKEVSARGVEIMRLGASRLGRPVYEKFGFGQDHEWLSKRLK